MGSVSQLHVQFTLPELLRSFPWNRKLNPNYEKVKAESQAWFESFHAFSPKAQDAFNRCDFNLLAALAYPNASAEHLRICCDLMNLFFAFDEYTDVCDAQEARRLADIVMDVLRNPELPRPQDESVILIGEITKQFWLLAKKTSVESAQRIFIESFDTYTTAVVAQAEDRVSHHLRADVDSYLEIRRQTIGMEPSFVLLHLETELPEGFLSDPLVKHMTTLAIDMARGDDGHNMVTIVMSRRSLNLDEALLWISDYYDNLVKSFQETYVALRERLASDTAISYLEGMAYWVRANDCWSFESERYFGKKGATIQKTRLVELLPCV